MISNTKRFVAILGLIVLCLTAIVPTVQAWDYCSWGDPTQTVDTVTNAALSCQQTYYLFEENPATGVHDAAAWNDVPNPAADESAAIPDTGFIPAIFTGHSQLIAKDAQSDAPASVWAGLTSSPGYNPSLSTYAVLDAYDVGSLTAYADEPDPGQATGPATYLAAETAGHPITQPTGDMWLAWYGFFQPNGNDFISMPTPDTAAGGCGANGFCAGSNFAFRGHATGELMQGLQWDFPGGDTANPGPGAIVGDSLCLQMTQAITGSCSDGASEVGFANIGAGLAGNCQRWSPANNNPYGDDQCVGPTPSGTWTDYSSAGDGGNSQSWTTGGGWETESPEESLIMDHYVVNIFGPSSLSDASPTQYPVNLENPTPQGYFRDTNYYQAIAPGVQDLYLNTLHPVRDMVDTALATPCPGAEVCAAINAAASGNQLVSSGCPTDKQSTAPAVCQADVRQDTAAANLNAVTPAGATYMPYVSGVFAVDVPLNTYAGFEDPAFASYWCGQISSATCYSTLTGLGAAGVFGWGAGGVGTVGGPLGSDVCIVAVGCEGGRPTALTTFMPPGYTIVPEMQAWAWSDVDQDGFIGNYPTSPTQSEIDNYNAGLVPSANDFTATNQGGTSDILLPLAHQLPGVYASPGAAGWPPGSFKVNWAWDIYASQTANPTSNYKPYLQPLSGSQTVFLNKDRVYCLNAQATRCPTEDALIIPTGTALGLTGAIPAQLSWTETGGTTTFSFSENATWTQSV